MEKYFVIECPHCQDNIVIYEQEINCSIFRHAVFKKDGLQLPPHAPKQVCDKLKELDLIYGCGKPFRIIKSVIHDVSGGVSEHLEGMICDYI